MESDEEGWMHRFHEKAQEERDETRELRERVRQLSVQVEEGERVRRDYEVLREEEKERREREGRAYEREMDEFKQFVLNNFPGRRGRPVADEVNRSRYQKDAACNTDDEQERAAKRSTMSRNETPAGYARATATDPAVFLRKREKDQRDERRSEAFMNATESEESEEERSTAVRRKQLSKPWPLKREKRVVGSGMLQRRMNQPQQKEITPETYSGEANLQEYISQFESCAAWNGWTERQKAQQLYMSLRGRARGVIRQANEWQTITYYDLVRRLEGLFSGQEELYLAQLRSRQQQPQESLQDFAQAIRKLTDGAYAGMPEDSRNRIARDYFMDNLRDRELRSAIHLSRPVTMEDAFRTALETEAFLAAEKQKHPTKYARVIDTADDERKEQMTEVITLLKDLVEKMERQESKQEKQTDDPGKENATDNRPWNGNGRGRGQGLGRGRGARRCYNCGAFDHFIAFCPHLQGNSVSVPGRNQQGNANRPNHGAQEGSRNDGGAPTQTQQ